MIPWNKGIPMSIETRKKLSLIRKGRTAWNKGKRCDPLWVERIRTARLGTKQSKEVVAKRIKTIKERFNGHGASWYPDRSKLKSSEKKHLDVNYIYWARAVKNRDKWKCKLESLECSGNLESHHISPWRENEKLRYSINNGITLCHFHHPRKYKDEKKLESLFHILVSNYKEEKE